MRRKYQTKGDKPGRPSNSSLITASPEVWAEVEMINEQLRQILKMENIHPTLLPPLAGTSLETIRCIWKDFKGKRSKYYHIVSLVKILNFLGYEMIFVKKRNAKSWRDDPDMIAAVMKSRQYHEKYDRARKGHTEPKRKPFYPDDTVLLTRSERKLNSKTGNIIISRAEEVDKAKREDDFLTTD